MMQETSFVRRVHFDRYQILKKNATFWGPNDRANNEFEEQLPKSCRVTPKARFTT
jgi:hypothetical protein